eukprot:3805269-Amphidinium_carterae.1
MHGSPPSVWLDLAHRSPHDNRAAKQLGMLSRVMAEAVYAARRDESPLSGTLIPAALVAISLRS